jgi:glycosyltransferase involved in cell wall biosynthesis
VSDRSSLPEITSDAACIVDPLDVRAIATGMRQLLDPSHCDRWAERGRRRATEFSWRRAGQQTLDILTDAESCREG